MFEFLAERDPFHLDAVLISLNSGEVMDKSVNVFQAQAIGESLIQSIAATSKFYYKFRKEDMTIIIKTNACVNIEDRVVEIDPRFFFQRLIVFIQPEETNDDFSYDFCVRPRSLSNKKVLMNETHKSILKNALLDQLGLSECICLLFFKIPIMSLIGGPCCKDFHGLLEARLMKYFNPSNTIC